MRAAGKTGTTSSNNDRWFVGFTPYYVGAVWFGYDEPTPLKGFSPNPAAVAWRKVMSEVHTGLKDKPFFADLNSSERMVMVCAESGMRVTPSCTKLTAKKFKLNQVPSDTCTEHKYKFNKDDLDDGGNIIKKNTVVQGTVEDIFSEEGESSSENVGTEIPPSTQTESDPGTNEEEKPQGETPNSPTEEGIGIDGI